MQTIVNNLSEQCKAETREKDSEMDSDRESVHSNWSELIPTNSEVNNTSTTDNEIKKSERTKIKIMKRWSMSHIVHITLQFTHRRFTMMSEIFIIIAYLYMFKI